MAALWAEAQELANESLNVAQIAWETERAEAEKQRVGSSGAFDAQGAELESLRAKVAELQDVIVKAEAAAEPERQAAQAPLAALTDAAHTASARAEDLKTALEEAQGALRSQTAEMTGPCFRVQVQIATIHSSNGFIVAVLATFSSRIRLEEVL